MQSIFSIKDTFSPRNALAGKKPPENAVSRLSATSSGRFWGKISRSRLWRDKFTPSAWQVRPKTGHSRLLRDKFRVFGPFFGNFSHAKAQRAPSGRRPFRCHFASWRLGVKRLPDRCLDAFRSRNCPHAKAQSRQAGVISWPPPFSCAPATRRPAAAARRCRVRGSTGTKRRPPDASRPASRDRRRS